MKKFLFLIFFSVFIGSCSQKNVSKFEYTFSKDIKPESIPSTWKCPDCDINEKHVLSEIQNKTNIIDRNALATIMGNIKQESGFIANVCEGGQRLPYNYCKVGGYGIIQWTTPKRYNGLGHFSVNYKCNPSKLECQTRYMINESVFQKYLSEFEVTGNSISEYMIPAYSWLGWGIKGKREIYSHQYAKMLVLS